MTWQCPVADGWWPSLWLSPEREIYVSYGAGTCRLAKLTRSGTTLTQQHEQLLVDGAKGGRWRHPYELVAWQYTGGAAGLRKRLDVRVTPWQMADEAQIWQGVSITLASDGHFVESDPGYVALDGGVLARGCGHSNATSSYGANVAYATDNSHDTITRHNADGTYVVHRVASPLHQSATGPDGRCAYGGYGAIYGFAADPAATVDLTVTPWRWEALGCVWQHHDGTHWLATSSFEDAGPLVLLRPWGEQACVIVHRGAVASGISVVEDGDVWLVATNDEKGRLWVDVVPFDTPRDVLRLPPARLPTFAPTDTKIGIGCFAEPSSPGLAIVTMDGSVDARYPVTAETRAVFCDHRGNVDGSRRLAADLGVPALYYLDAYGLSPDMVPAGFRPALFGYPRGGVAVADTLALAEADMARMHAAGRSFDLIVAGYCQFRSPGVYAVTEQQVLDTLGALWPLTLQYGGQAWWAFHFGRYYNGELVDGVSYWPSISESVRRVREASADWRTFPTRAVVIEPPKPPIKPPTPIKPPKPEAPVAAVKYLVLCRQAEQTRYLSFADNRSDVDARLTDPKDARTWLEVTVYDQPGVGAPGKFAYGNKVILRSREDQVCVYPEQSPATVKTSSSVRGVKASLDLAGMFDLRAGEFPNTAALGLPAQSLAMYVTEQGALEWRDLNDSANIRSRFDWRPFEVAADGTTKELTIPF